MADLPFFHEASETVRFWVTLDEEVIGAMVGKHTLHYRFDPCGLHDGPMTTFRIHRQEVEAAVRRRVVGGATQPILLREPDLPRESRGDGIS
jgi:hypothetical protein